MTMGRTLLFTLAIAALAVPGVSHAQLTVSHLTSDAELNNFLTHLVMVAEGRIGDRGGAATFELDLGQDTAAPVVQAQYPWVSGQVEPFSLVYDQGTNTVTFQLGGESLEYNPGPNFDEVFIRTRATRDQSHIRVDNLFLDGIAVNDASDATGPDPGGLDILRIQGANLEDGFVLTGDATLTWGSPVPNNSHLAFQIKIGKHDPPTQSLDGTWGRLKTLFR